MRIGGKWIAIGSVLLATGFVAGTVAAGSKKEILGIAVGDLKWAAVPNLPIQTAGPFKGSKGIECNFHKFPKGFAAPLHTHTQDVLGMVVAGSFGSVVEGGTAALLPTGSFQHIPGGLKHTSKCSPDADCTMFICQPGAFDMKVVPAPKGAAKEGAATPKEIAPTK